jgi:hypothetical protein
MSNAHANTLDRIEAANLPLAVYRTARRLLDRAMARNGYLEISHDEMLKICETEAWGTVRRHLIALQGAGIIKKWLNHSARVWFVDYPAPAWLGGVITERAEVIILRSPADDHGDDENSVGSPGDQIRANDERFRANDERFRAGDDQNRAQTAPPIGWLVGFDPNTSILPDQDQTNQPTNQVAQTAEEQERSKRLLSDPEILAHVGNREAYAAKTLTYANEHAFPWLLQQVGSWWADMQARRVRSIGALYKRIDSGWTPDPWPDEFLESDLYARHYPLDDSQRTAWSAYQQYEASRGVILGYDHYVEMVNAWPDELFALAEQLPAPIQGGAP